MLYEVTWMNKETRERHHGFVIARTHDDAFDTVMGKLQDGYIVTHVYMTSWNMVTPQSVCFNFSAPDYELFG